jgi:hypothetical protein
MKHHACHIFVPLSGTSVFQTCAPILVIIGCEVKIVIENRKIGISPGPILNYNDVMLLKYLLDLCAFVPKQQGVRIFQITFAGNNHTPYYSKSMLAPSTTNSYTQLLLLLLLSVLLAAEAGRRKKETVEQFLNDEGEEVPEVHWLVELIGKEIYSIVSHRKYKFYIYMIVGKLPDEHSAILLLSTLCNVLYGMFVVVGFLFLPRGFMLFGTLATLYFGPAMVLILLGSIGVAFAAFALYPITSVVGVWCFFFLISPLAQTIGRKLGLDHDKDGDVDFLDILHLVSETRWGKAIGLHKFHDMLNEATRDPFQEIHRRLDEIHASIRQVSSSNDGTSTVSTTEADKHQYVHEDLNR